MKSDSMTYTTSDAMKQVNCSRATFLRLAKHIEPAVRGGGRGRLTEWRKADIDRLAKEYRTYQRVKAQLKGE